VWVEQAIFTSLLRHGRGGYHLVSRSPGVREADVQVLSTWSPSHGALLMDSYNRVSVNFHPLAEGRYALSRTCEGPPEYSGRGGRQLYTHILLIDDATLQAVGGQPLTLYRDALALGHPFYQANPPEVLEPAMLSACHIRRDPEAWATRAKELGLPPIEPLLNRLKSGRAVRYAYVGDRLALAECLIGALPPDAYRRISFTTSLVPSSVRPYIISLVGSTDAQQIRSDTTGTKVP
jgi:hypothetical protein